MLACMIALLVRDKPDTYIFNRCCHDNLWKGNIRLLLSAKLNRNYVNLNQTFFAVF